MDDVEEDIPATRTATVEDVVAACPDAMEFVGPVRSDREFILGVSRLRGSFGLSPSAWEEAGREIGPLGAAGLLVYVVQMQMRPAPGSEGIENAGGYFRAIMRLIKAGKIELMKEIKRLRI